MVSVIIPLDSKSRHCVPAMNSILSQGKETYEILILPVAGEEVLAFAEEIVRDRQLVRILPQCLNMADAVNSGIAAARGEYIHICTGREILGEGVYAEILAQMRQTQADVCCFGWQDHTGTEMCAGGFNGVGNMQAFLELILTDPGAAGDYSSYGTQLWNKVFRRDVFFVEGAQIAASNECLGLMEPVWLSKLAINCERAVFSGESLLKRETPVTERIFAEDFDFSALCKQEKEALAFVETLSSYAYRLMLQVFFSYEIGLLLRCREQKLVKMAAAIESHLMDFYGIPYEEKRVIRTFIRAEHQQKSIAGLRRDVAQQRGKVLELSNQAEGLKADRAFLKRKTESQQKRIEGLEADRTFLKRKTESQQKRIEGLEADRTFLKRKTESQQKRIEGLDADKTFLKRKTESQLREIEELETTIYHLKKRKAELAMSLAEFEGSFLARTALKLNRLYRKILHFFFSSGKKQN